MKVKVLPGRAVSLDGSLYTEGSVFEMPDEQIAQLVRGGAVVIEPVKAEPVKAKRGRPKKKKKEE